MGGTGRGEGSEVRERRNGKGGRDGEGGSSEGDVE